MYRGAMFYILCIMVREFLLLCDKFVRTNELTNIQPVKDC